MRQLPRPRATIASSFLAGLLAVLLLAAAALPALAKEFMQATLDAPIAMGTPGGTEILVGVTVTVPDGDVIHSVEGSPIYLKLVGRDGSFTRASGIPDQTPGHYMMRIVVPGGGARRAEVGIHGTTDLSIMLMADPFAFGGITARTAQVAPALAPPITPPITPFPRASTGAAAGTAAAGSEPAMAAAGTAAPGSGPSPLPSLLAGVVALAAVAGLALAMRRRSRLVARRIAPERAPDT